MTVRYLAIGFMLLVSNMLVGQRYNFINYSIQDDLAHSQARAICQDSSGYLWIGTLYGVSRFDGTHFDNYSKLDGLMDNNITSIVLSKTNHLWFGTVGGIIEYDGSSFTNHPLPNASQSLVISLAEDNNGNIWAATNGSGVVKFDGAEFEFFDQYSEGGPLPNDVVRSVFFDGEKLWIGTYDGLSVYDGNTFKDSTVIPALNDANISSIIRDQKGHMWFGTTNGMYKYNGDSLYHFTVEDGLVDNNVRCVFEDVSGNIWIGSYDGVSKWNGERFFTFDKNDGMQSSRIRYIYQDNEYNLWISTDGSGIMKFSGEAFVNFSAADGLCSSQIMSVTEGRDGSLWYSTYDNAHAVCRFDGEKYITYGPENGLRLTRYWTSLTTRDGKLLFGASDGLYVYDPNENPGSEPQFKSYRFEEGNDSTALPHSKVSSLYEDHRGDIWVGTTLGVSRWDGEKFEHFVNTDDFPGRKVRSIIQDSKQNYWFGTAHGVVKYNGTEFTLFNTENGLPENTVYCLENGANGSIWIGTAYGLVYYDGYEMNTVMVGDEYSENNINFLLGDDDNRLWIGTNKGLFRMDLKKWYANREIDLDLFTDLDGIKSYETNLNSAFKDSKGDLWFGTSESLVRFTPNAEKVIKKQHKPFINITSLELFLSQTDWEMYADSVDAESGLPIDLSLQYNKNYLTFRWVGISHTNPEKVRYKFMLEGFDEDWLPITDAKFTTYSNLPHGFYTFKVLAQNKDGDWSPQAASFSFVIETPYWLSWWFILLCVAALILIIFAIYNWRMKVNRRKQETEQLVNKSKMLALEQQTLNSSMNRHFIFNALNSIQYYINRQDRLSANKYLTSFAKLVRKNLDSSQTNLVSLSEELERLELYLTLEHMRFQQKFKYEIVVDPELDAETTKIPAMLLQPYIENSIWHGILPMESEDGVITVAIKRVNRTVVFSIEDNGIGISTSMKNKGEKPQDHISKGMSITRGRINLLRKMTNETIYIEGPYDIKDDDGEPLGTKVEIVLPIDENYLWN